MLTESFADTEREFYAEYENDYDAQLSDLAERFAHILAEKHLKEGKYNASVQDEVLRPDMSLYRHLIKARQHAWEYAEF